MTSKTIYRRNDKLYRNAKTTPSNEQVAVDDIILLSPQMYP